MSVAANLSVVFSLISHLCRIALRHRREQTMVWKMTNALTAIELLRSDCLDDPCK